ncbi:organic hydroperoxide resistance protein [Paenibacillus radicis (ex Gao et al. 2016)]|uniref:Organic hydroperoxide resistance protein n=1 Tax=Paenibacillus radicis (ex Gao et al. 2016) TaxID=1737354 RepID=A0A917H7S6_9BACL|nr:organic hydroperoxide resistance protein [Paenibacillus radicis (ex Gao et al. 2016)]GGG70234.1 organic hydroperoxide resistance protein [Paenibacillus radicis (ex Gao et al. 2016)]
MDVIEKKLYTATVTVEGGREGKAVSSDGVLDMELKVPKELGGPGGHGSNPEQLFAAGFAACFEGAIGVVLRKKKMKTEGTKITSQVTIGKDANDGFVLSVYMDISIKGLETNVSKEIVEEAHEVCPYSRATRGNIEVITNVVE